jgi:sulfur relay (sulfurtransferase) complex TusBCD TusD component (DsrE family)
MPQGQRARDSRGDVKTLVVLNDPAYGTERSYNGLRLAHSLAKRDGEEVRSFLLADAVTCALAGQKPHARLAATQRIGESDDTR